MIWPLVSGAEMRRLDRYSIETCDISGEILMESAGRAVVDVALAELTASAANLDRVIVVCGTGNNGGDGFVAARHLHQLGVPVRVMISGDADRTRGDAAANLHRAQRLGVPFGDATRDWDAASPVLVIDALFGTGLARALGGEAAAAVERIAAAKRTGSRVIAIDLPSGVDADTGRVWGSAVSADVTVTIGLPKLGLALEPGRSLAGRVLVARVGIVDRVPDAPDATEGRAQSAVLWSPAEAGARLPRRARDGHKGRFGHVLVVAGAEGKTGAAALAARGACRGGAGLVTIACPAGLNDILEVKCTEAMTVPVADTPSRGLAAAAEDRILALAAERDVVAWGPGIGREAETQSLTRAVAKRLDRPLLLDADGLFPFAEEPGVLRARNAPTLLTPHPGEAARLLGCSADDINADRVGSARKLAELTGAVVLLKGAGTVIAGPAPGDALIVNPTGGPALGAGGTGDVLSGLVAALLGQGLSPLDAAAAGAYLHGAAADGLATRRGGAGLLASEIADAIPEAAEELRERDRAARAFGGHPPALVLPFPGA